MSSAQTRALISPQMDFWLLGGFSLLMLCVFWVMTEILPFGHIVQVIPWWIFYLSFFVNYPHFAFSYQVFYEKYWHYLHAPGTGLTTKLRLYVAGILVPAMLAGYFYQAYTSHDPQHLTTAIHIMLFFVCWHYAKQGYGAFITLSVYKGVFFSQWQKRLLYIHAHVAWVVSWILTNDDGQRGIFYDVKYYMMDFPDWTLMIGRVAIWTTGLAAAAGLLWAAVIEKKTPPINGMVGYLAPIYLWLIPPGTNMAYFFCIPLFHSLQYLPFVYKYKRTQIEQTTDPKNTWLAPAKLIAFCVTGAALGAIFMDLLPKQLDSTVFYEKGNFTSHYFLFSAVVFVNIHHYFIDNAFWRRDNSDVQSYLFKA